MTKPRFKFWHGTLIFIVGFSILVWQAKNPIHSLWSEGFQVLGGGALATGLLVMVWKWRVLRWALLVLSLGCAGLFALPGRSINADELRGRYVKNLLSFTGTPYVWGGESRIGVDCSGLARRAWREALWTEGLATLNGRLLREAAYQWCTDATARELAAGASGTTIPVLSEVTSANKVDVTKLKPGDFAVTGDGLHLLVFIGDVKWIEADPGLHVVLTLEASRDDNPWLAAQVHIYRWKELG